MAIEAVDALLGVPAQLVLVDDRVLLLAVTLGAFAGSQGTVVRLRRAVERLTRNALTINANATTTAMNTGRNDISALYRNPSALQCPQWGNWICGDGSTSRSSR